MIALYVSAAAALSGCSRADHLAAFGALPPATLRPLETADAALVMLWRWPVVLWTHFGPRSAPIICLGPFSAGSRTRCQRSQFTMASNLWVESYLELLMRNEALPSLWSGAVAAPSSVGQRASTDLELSPEQVSGGEVERSPLRTSSL